MEMFLFVVILLTGGVFLVSSNSSWLCFLPVVGENNSSSVCGGQSEELKCEEGKLILINDVKFFAPINLSTNNCNDCSRDDSVILELKSSNLRRRLHEVCSQKNKCSLKNTVEAPTAWMSMWYADITYNCIEKDLFKDMCLPWEKSVGKNGLHLILGDRSSSPHLCSCETEAVVGSASIMVVDYRPYKDDNMCADSTFFVNGQTPFQCFTTTSIDYSVYNEPIAVNNNITNITIAIHSSSPLMLWYFVEGRQETYVRCNKRSLEPTMSTVKSDELGTTSTTTLIEQKKSSNEHHLVSLIAGTAVGVTAFILIVILVAFLYVRRQRITAKREGNAHFCVGLQNTRTTRIKNGDMKNSYDSGYENVFRIQNSSNEQDVDINCDYLEPVHAEVSNTYVEANIVYNSGNANKSGGYQELFANFTEKNDNDSKYEDLRPVIADSNACNTLEASNYSNIDNCSKDEGRQCDTNYDNIPSLKLQQN